MTPQRPTPADVTATMPTRSLTEAQIARANASFDARYEVSDDGCWIWTGARNRGGYGTLSVANKHFFAHRWSYLRAHGPIPLGLVLDHFVCSNPPCVNPDHVRPVTHRENLLRCDGTVSAVNIAKMACPQGHPYTKKPGFGPRRCHRCATERMRAAGRKPWQSPYVAHPRRPLALASGLAFLATQVLDPSHKTGETA